MIATQRREKVIGPSGPVTLADLIDIEGLLGRELLDELAAVTAELEGLKEPFAAFMARAVAVARAFDVATSRIVDLDGTPGSPDGLFEVIQSMAGMRALDDLALDVGLSEAILEGPGPRALKGGSRS